MSRLAPPKAYFRIIIENVTPEIDTGRYPVKRVVGDVLEVTAAIFMDGHDSLAGVLCMREAGETVWKEIPLNFKENDQWSASFELSKPGSYEYTIKAWPDLWGTWHSDTLKKRAAGLDISLELQEGVALVRKLLGKSATRSYQPIADDMLSNDFLLSIKNQARRLGEVQYNRILRVTCDRKRAAFSAWYEIFPRSQGNDVGQSGTFADCEERLPDIHAMGFDVLYLTPIHPIGITHRKGKNNALVAEKNDPGSPYAIGGKEGGHMAVHPDVGTLEDFGKLVQKAKQFGMDVALDFALQVSRDHPYITQHPEWFVFRPDGTIKFAENPPKKYEDIVNFDFESGPELWEELRRIVLFWIEQGVTIFRVDNPHTKPFVFWEWLIETVQNEHPDIIFLAEAFTRPKPMYLLAKLGFTQSYTYFTWRHTKAEFIHYIEELVSDKIAQFFRPNFFPATPDILPEYIQQGGKPAFIIRLTLAATLAGNYGMLAGYELLEGEGLAGKEEYKDSEKYQFKPRDWNAPGNIKPLVTALNRIRNDNPVFQDFTNIVFYPAESEHILFYGKICHKSKNAVFIAVNLDYHATHDTMIELPLEMLGIEPHVPYRLDDLLLGHSWSWIGNRQHLQLDPHHNPVTVFRINMP